MSNQSKGRPGGVLPINAAATKKPATTQKPSQRIPAPRLRLIVRRLPPGLVENEFWEALGTEWQTGNGKVDYHSFREGKISKDPSKPSRPGRAYIKVKDQSLLEILSAKVKASSFKDSKNTSGDPCLVGPPSLEFAPYNKTPSGRNRHDGRQGTIDQDQEFIDFLQSLTEPIAKSVINGADAHEAKPEKVVITPLVQFIKEKKANKAKEKEAAAAAKSSKKNQEPKEGKAKGDSQPTVVVKSKTAAADKARIAKATQEAVKAANKSAAHITNKTASSKAESKSNKESIAMPASVPTPAAKPERQRGSASAASRMIARDLGLAPKEPRTPRTARNATASVPVGSDNVTKTESQSKVAQPAPPTANKTTATAVPVSSTTQTPTTPTGPRNNRSNQTTQAKPAPQPSQRPSKSGPQPSAGAKSAFLKHANPSQGVTEDLLRTTFSQYGEVTRCEIDKKKGLGYVDFVSTEALKKAMTASPVKVGNGQVVVLENRSPYKKGQAQPANTAQQPSAASVNSRAPSVTSSAVASAVTSPQPKPAVIATVEKATPTTALPVTKTLDENIVASENIAPADSQATALPTTAAPTAPKAARGGNTPARPGRGGAGFAPGRGGFNQSPARGRGNFRGRGARGGRAVSTPATTTAPSQAAPVSAATSATGAQTGGGDSSKSVPSETT